ncbi:uncharacterized protein LOC104903315 [Beta vulgaris subsp. vulgaris]|uniref:uncharacterized protein LOC104903315 n=1 Tax=Beta vulgaris subsp. vulgaris TaxID=3555 RepID=UPI0020366B1D|nr:uncharacterized protein LOC104903315 [Beta vulgaris subsp. vulgaris]
MISDEAQDILGGVAKIFPQAEHRHCARHVYAHWHKTYKGDEMKQLLWRAAKSYNEADLGDALTEMEKVNPESVVEFKKYNPKVFCRAHVKTNTKCDVIINNMVGTFNGYIIDARAEHIIFMLEDIRTALMQRMVIKRQQMEKSTAKICPRIQSRLEKEKDEAANCTPLPSSSTLFQVAHKMDTLTVDLEKRSCTCRKWDLSGVSCCHGIACIFFLHHEAEDYVDECYKREAYLKMYCGGISLLTGERHWPKVDMPLDPPPIKIGPGRPRKNRIKDPREDPKRSGKLSKHGVEMSCSVRKNKGNNKRTCPDKGKAVEPTPKKTCGRPRKDITQPINTASSSPPPSHHETTVQPSRIGKNGRVVGKMPQGVGVLFDGHGNTPINVQPDISYVVVWFHLCL